MRNVSTMGFLTNSSKTVAFTIPLNKPVIADEITFDSLNIQVRNNNGLLINEDVMESDYTVVSEIVENGISVAIISNESFDSDNDIPLSIYITEAEGRFA